MRRNLVLGSVALVLGLGLLGFLLVRWGVRAAEGETLEARMVSDGVAFERMMELESRALADQVRDRAATSAVVSALAAGDEAARRARAHEAANKVAEWFRDPSRRGKAGRPDVVLVTDAAGRVIARDIDPNRMVGRRLSEVLPALKKVLAEGSVESDVRADSAEGLATQQLAAAPVRDERGAIRGALVVGYGLSDGLLASHAEILGRDLALLVDGSLVATSLSGAAAKDLERALGEEPLAARLGKLTDREAPRFDITLSGEERRALARRLPLSEGVAVTAVVLSRPADLAPLLRAVNLLWPLTGAFAVIALVFGWVMANKVLVPVGIMEERVLAIINGDTEQRVEVDEPDLGGLAYRINQLVSALSGAPEGAPEKGEGWGTLDSTLSTTPVKREAGSLPTDPVDDPQIASVLSAEPEEDYLARVFREYAAEKRAVGEDIGQISEQKFGERLRASARSMGEKHGCPVRFRVERADGRVILRPVLLRDGAA